MEPLKVPSVSHLDQPALLSLADTLEALARQYRARAAGDSLPEAIASVAAASGHHSKTVRA